MGGSLLMNLNALVRSSKALHRQHTEKKVAPRLRCQSTDYPSPRDRMEVLVTMLSMRKLRLFTRLIQQPPSSVFLVERSLDLCFHYRPEWYTTTRATPRPISSTAFPVGRAWIPQPPRLYVCQLLGITVVVTHRLCLHLLKQRWQKQP